MRPVIAAMQWTRVLQLLDDGEIAICASPVVAWYAEPDGVVPVTARGAHDGLLDRDYVVEFPTGEVVAVGVGAWPSRAACLGGMSIQHRQLPLDLAA